eukprot:gene2689-3351_t
MGCVESKSTAGSSPAIAEGAEVRDYCDEWDSMCATHTHLLVDHTPTHTQLHATHATHTTHFPADDVDMLRDSYMKVWLPFAAALEAHLCHEEKFLMPITQ